MESIRALHTLLNPIPSNAKNVLIASITFGIGFYSPSVNMKNITDFFFPHMEFTNFNAKLLLHSKYCLRAKRGTLSRYIIKANNLLLL